MRLDPRMHQDHLRGRSLRWVDVQHLTHQILRQTIEIEHKTGYGIRKRDQTTVLEKYKHSKTTAAQWTVLHTPQVCDSHRSLSKHLTHTNQAHTQQNTRLNTSKKVTPVRNIVP